MVGYQSISSLDFLRGMAVWMQNKNYRIGVQPHSIDLRDGISANKQFARIAEQVAINLFGGGDIFGPFVSGGGKAQDVVQALTPYAPLVDLLGLRITNNGVTSNQDLILVICGDSAQPDLLIERFKRFLELGEPVANLGMRINFKRLPFWFFPLVFYFDNQVYERHASALLNNGWSRKAWKNLYLRTCLINIPCQTVLWSDVGGIINLADSFWSALGSDFYKPFSSDDLQIVLKKSQELSWRDGQLHPDYPNVIASQEEGRWHPAPGYNWVDVQKNLQVKWFPGQIHRDYPNVIAAQKEGEWIAAPGYEWANPTDPKDLRVVWSPGKNHPNYPNVIAGEDGKWYPAPGYMWIDVNRDLQVVWSPGQVHRDYSNVVAAQKEDTWHPALGYSWVNVQKDLQVVWISGHPHPNYPNVIAGKDEKWYPAPGYRWADIQKDLQVIWVPGLIHQDHPNVVAAQKEANWLTAPGYKWANPTAGDDLQVVWCPGQLHRENQNLIASQKEGEWHSITPQNSASSSTSGEKVVTSCPSCSQKLRAPTDQRTLTLSCPKCKSSWQWPPLTKLDEKLITSCPSCSQKLRAPTDRGTLTLSCPKCKNSWRWSPVKRS